MVRLIEQLTEARIRKLSSLGLHADGRGLYLQIHQSGGRSWIFRYTLNKQTRDMGLGALADVSLVQARVRAAEERAKVAKGIDPLEERRSARAERSFPATTGPTFEEAAEAYMAEKLKRLRSEVHRRQWRYSLEAFAYPVIGRKPVARVDTADVLAVLRPIWESTYETANRLRGRIERILARATVEGLRTGANPATWRGHLQEALPPRSEVSPIRHHPAMPYQDVPAFMAELRAREEMSADALQFLILTGTRTNETLGARWPEVSWADKTWTVPAERAKSGKPHVVPLSTESLKILEEVREADPEFIFPGRGGGGAMSQMTLLALLQRRMQRPFTCHGFRSSFRDWCGDEAGVDRELAELSLAHTVRDQTERAYRRMTAVERRRVVMQGWCDYCCTPPADGAVVDFASKKAQCSPAA